MGSQVYEVRGTEAIFKIEGSFVVQASGGQRVYQIQGPHWYALPRELNDKPECEVRGSLVYPYFPGSTAIYEIR
jgi:hypothetical protein